MVSFGLLVGMGFFSFRYLELIHLVFTFLLSIYFHCYFNWDHNRLFSFLFFLLIYLPRWVSEGFSAPNMKSFPLLILLFPSIPRPLSLLRGNELVRFS